MVAAATAILKDIDLSKKIRGTVQKVKGRLDPAVKSGPVRSWPAGSHQILTASVKRALCTRGGTSFSSRREGNVRNKVNDLKTTVPAETPRGVIRAMTMA
jgi:hypothetical protein